MLQEQMVTYALKQAHATRNYVVVVIGVWLVWAVSNEHARAGVFVLCNIILENY